MSRRRLLWARKIIQVTSKGKTVDDLMPDNVKGEGVYLTSFRYENPEGGLQFKAPSTGKGRGSQVSLPMSQRREEWVRRIAKKLEK